MNRTGSNNSRDAKLAVMGASPGEMLDHIIERAEAARLRYLTRLSEPQLGTYSRHQHQLLLWAIELRLEHLRANREARRTYAAPAESLVLRRVL
jgi:hypothetical protein